MKKCNKCEISKELTEFYRDKRRKDGRTGQCKECRSVYFKEHSKTDAFKASMEKYRTTDKYKVAIKKYRKKYEKTEKRKEWNKKWRSSPEQKERVSKNNKEFFSSEKGKEYMRKWRKTPQAKAKSNHNTAMRRARKKQACPIWLSKEQKKEIRNIYLECQRITLESGIMHHVDHILPLAGKTISGLHVPWNLQIIEGSVNCKKNNRLE